MQLELWDMIGFRFVPTSEELLWFYLIPMITGENPFPPDMTVPHIPFIDDLYSLSPEDITEQVSIRVDREFIYAFTRVKRVAEGGKNIARATKVGEDGSGKGKCWRMQHGENVKLENGEIGMHHTLSYSVKKSNGGLKSMHWVMDEFSLPDRGSDWVICRMHYDAKRAASSGRTSGCSSLSSVEQPQRLPLPLPPPPQPLPMKRMMVSNGDQTGATSDLVRPTKNIKVSNTVLDELHVQRQQFAHAPCEQIINKPQEIQCNNQETHLVDQAIQDQPQDEHQSTDQVQESQEMANRKISLEEIYRFYGDIIDPFSELSFDRSDFLGEELDDLLNDIVVDESLLLALDDPDLFKDLPQFFDR